MSQTLLCARVATMPTPPEEVVRTWGQPTKDHCAFCFHEVWIAPASRYLLAVGVKPCCVPCMGEGKPFEDKKPH